MKYCIHCGSPLGDNDSFCSRCGSKADEISVRSESLDGRNPVPDASAEPKDKLVCELAYSGILFWLPILVSPKAKNARYHANQGLWVLIVSCILCWLVQLLGILKISLDGHIIGTIFNVVYFAVFAVFLAAMFCLAAQGIKRALAIHRDEEPETILFFEKKTIIR